MDGVLFAEAGFEGVKVEGLFVFADFFLEFAIGGPLTIGFRKANHNKGGLARGTEFVDDGFKGFTHVVGGKGFATVFTDAGGGIGFALVPEDAGEGKVADGHDAAFVEGAESPPLAFGLEAATIFLCAPFTGEGGVAIDLSAVGDDLQEVGVEGFSNGGVGGEGAFIEEGFGGGAAGADEENGNGALALFCASDGKGEGEAAPFEGIFGCDAYPLLGQGVPEVNVMFCGGGGFFHGVLATAKGPKHVGLSGA